MRNKIKQQSSITTAIAALIIVLFLGLGCKSVTDLVKSDKTSKDDKTSTTSSSDSDSGLAKNIVGRWEMPAGGKKLEFEFNSDKSVQSLVDGKVTTKGTYRIIDEKTIETKNTDGSVTETIPTKVEGDKLTLTYNNTNMTFTKK